MRAGPREKEGGEDRLEKSEERTEGEWAQCEEAGEGEGEDGEEVDESISLGFSPFFELSALIIQHSIIQFNSGRIALPT